MARTKKAKQNVLIGIISGTQGHLGPETFSAFLNADFIIHAGNIGSPEILNRLEKIAPVYAVKGTDDSWAPKNFRPSKVIKAAKNAVYITHSLNCLKKDLAAKGYKVVITGDKTAPLIEERNRILYINPGSAGESKETATVALLVINSHDRKGEIINLDRLKRRNPGGCYHTDLGYNLMSTMISTRESDRKSLPDL